MSKVEKSHKKHELMKARLPRSYGVIDGNPHVWQLPAYHTRYGKRYELSIAIDLSALHLAESWVFDWMARLSGSAAEPQLHPAVSIQRLRVCLNILVSQPAFQSLASKPATQIRSLEIFQLFSLLEVGLSSLKTAHKQSLSSAFRGAFWRHAYDFGISRRLSAATVGFSTKFETVHAAKRLLGDLVDNLPPLGATEHVDIPDLKAKLRLKAEAGLNNLRDAAIADLEMGARLRQYLFECADELSSLEFLEKVSASSMKGQGYPTDKMPYPEILEDKRQLIGACVLVIRAHGLAYKSVNGTTPYTLAIEEFLFKEIKWSGGRGKLLRALEYATPEEVNAAGIILHTYTGWNIASSLDLSFEQVRRVGDSIELQSYKSKTDTDTPVVYLSAKDPGVVEAIELLIWNHHRLIELGYKERGDGRLWRSGKAHRVDGRPEPQQIVKSIRARHDLPIFTLEMVRRQKIFIESLTSVESARRMAGHASLTTTTIYLCTDVADRLNSSISLQMQRQLEAEIQYVIGIETSPLKGRPMLHPVGDGASCLDPLHPPHGLSIGEAVCGGRECHTGEGCSNRRLIIDKQRMREIVVASKMYRENWKRLHSRNPEEFSRYHLPAMLFNAALVELMVNGPHAHIYKKIEKNA